MILNKQFETQVITNLSKLFKDTYNRCLNKDDFDDFLDLSIKSFKKEISSMEEIEGKYVSQKNDYNRKIKAKIFNQLIENTVKEAECFTNPKKTFEKLTEGIENIEIINTAPKEIFEIYLVYNQLKILGKKDILKEIFNNQYNSESFQDFLTKTFNEILIWSRDNSQFISSYKYINTYYSHKEIKKWISKDISLYLYKNLKEHLYSHKKILSMNNCTSFSIHPMDYNVKHPIDASNRKKTNQLEGKSHIYVHELKDGDVKIKTFIDIPNSHLNGNPKLYNLFDNEVIQAFIKLSSIDFWTTYTVDCEFGDIVETLSPNNRSGKLYDQVYDSITKTSSYKSIHQNIKTKEYTTYEIYTAKIYNPNGDISENFKRNKYKGLRVKVIFNQDYISKLISSIVFTDDNSEYSLKNNLARALIAPLQSVRYQCIENGTMTVYLGYHSFFCKRVILSRNKSRDLKNLEEALDDIRKTKTILKATSRNKDIFRVDFNPLQNDEKQNIITYLDRFAENGISFNLPFQLNGSNKLI